ncbi:MAG TPA: hypothetical protein VGW57_05085 [Chthoniobacterales bacterium]|nr:hypothetical protein [Chthoniobacterales bacterium]
MRIVFVALVQLLLSCYVVAGDNGPPRSPEKIDKSFVRSFDFGRWATPFVDPQHPPVLELVTLSWDRRRLMAGAFYHNSDFSDAKKVEGQQIVEWWTDGPLFWPYVSLEVSNEPEKGWTVIGSSPPRTDGTEAVVLMYPDKAAYVEHTAPNTPTCQIDLTPFRELTGKFKYGRAVLRSGGTSQTIVLTDLLAPEPTRTPASKPRGIARPITADLESGTKFLPTPSICGRAAVPADHLPEITRLREQSKAVCEVPARF